jgi:hypothetical protein
VLDAKIKDFITNESGDVIECLTEEGVKIKTDFIFDCSGFHRLLIGKLYKTNWVSYEKHLKVNSAIPFFFEQSKEEITPYTHAVAMKYGWIWKIPVQGRYGCGYVFDSSMTTDEEAANEIREYLGHDFKSPKTFNFSAGAYDNIDVVLPDTQKQYISDYEYEGIAAQRNTSGAYDFIDVDIPDTQKQFISDYEYEGIAGAQTQFSLKSKDAEYNAEIDPTRETLNIKAGYTPNAGGRYSGQDPDNIDMESKRLVGDSINERETNNSVPKQLTARAIDYCEVTQVPDYINANVVDNNHY